MPLNLGETDKFQLLRIGNPRNGSLQAGKRHHFFFVQREPTNKWQIQTHKTESLRWVLPVQGNKQKDCVKCGTKSSALVFLNYFACLPDV